MEYVTTDTSEGEAGAAEGSGEVEWEGYRNLSLYPACVTDQDCGVVAAEREEDYRCFQYMCYPWAATQGPFRQRSDT